VAGIRMEECFCASFFVIEDRVIDFGNWNDDNFPCLMIMLSLHMAAHHVDFDYRPVIHETLPLDI